jgi:choline dehydrogenase
MREFDYVIVGAGAAGCVLAHRLSASPGVSVALLEAGGSDKHPFIQMPKGLAKVMADPGKTWLYRADPEAATAFQPEVWARGRVLGGSSSVNGMMYVRGQPADFDDLARLSSDDWSWRHLGAAYRALEAHELGEAATRGGNGALRLTLADRRTPLTEAMIAAGSAMGLARKEDVNDPDNAACVGYASRTIWRGRRQSASTAFLDPVRHRSNLHVLADTTVDRIRFDGRRAVEVEVLSGGERSVLRARKEIILAAGAMASPGILQRSGVGAAAQLAQLGIDVIHDSPEVGRNLREHRGIIQQWRLKVPLSDNSEYAGLPLLRNMLRYYTTRSGAMASAAYEVGMWLKSDPAMTRPDIQFLVAPFTFDYATQRTALEKQPGMGIVGYPLRPTSSGEIHIRSRDPGELPELRPNYRVTAEDRALMVRTVQLAREFARQAPLQPFIESETFPGHACESDDAIIDAYDRFGTCGYHAVGSCRMGNDAASVVDPELRVRGVQGLRVADTSIFPQIPSGNTNAPTMAMAWRAADIILREAAR